MKKILVCVNNKEQSVKALKYACLQARSLGTGVDILCVVEPVEHNTIFSIADKIQEDMQQAAENLVNELANIVEQEFCVKVNSIVKSGIATDTIIDTIEQDGNYIMLLLGVADDGSSAKGNVMYNLTTSLGDDFAIPLVLIPGNITDSQIARIC